MKWTISPVSLAKPTTEVQTTKLLLDQTVKEDEMISWGFTWIDLSSNSLSSTLTLSFVPLIFLSFLSSSEEFWVFLRHMTQNKKNFSLITVDRCFSAFKAQLLFSVKAVNFNETLGIVSTHKLVATTKKREDRLEKVHKRAVECKTQKISLKII